jgi:protein TonB
MLPVSEPGPTAGRSRKLIWFVLASLLLHLLLAALWRGEPPAGPAGRSTFQITLVARQGDSPAGAAAGSQQTTKRTPPTPAETDPVAGEPPRPVETDRQHALPATEAAALQVAARTETRPPTHPKARSASAPEPATGEPPEQTRNRLVRKEAPTHSLASAAPGSTSQGHHELSSAARYHRVRQELLRALLPYFDYPSSARRRGWQGRVRVGLLVEADGDLTDIHLVESSGYAVLDKAAVRNVVELSQLPGASQWLGGRDMGIILPVSYRLEDR